MKPFWLVKSSETAVSPPNESPSKSARKSRGQSQVTSQVASRDLSRLTNELVNPFRPFHHPTKIPASLGAHVVMELKFVGLLANENELASTFQWPYSKSLG